MSDSTQWHRHALGEWHKVNSVMQETRERLKTKPKKCYILKTPLGISFVNLGKE